MRTPIDNPGVPTSGTDAMTRGDEKQTTEIRALRGPEDVRGLIRVHGRAWREAYRDILPESVLAQVVVHPMDEQVRERYEDLREDRDGVLLAVDEAGTARGYAYFRWGEETKPFVGPDEAGLKEIYLDPDYWGRGIGTRLLECGIERLPETVRRLKLETFAANDVGRGFYEARGFERVAENEVEIGGDTYPTIVYERALDGSDS